MKSIIISYHLHINGYNYHEERDGNRYNIHQFNNSKDLYVFLGKNVPNKGNVHLRFDNFESLETSIFESDAKEITKILPKIKILVPRKKKKVSGIELIFNDINP